jgi:hypothetical protein
MQKQTLFVSSTTNTLTYNNTNRLLKFDHKKKYRVSLDGLSIRFASLNDTGAVNVAKSHLIRMEYPADDKYAVSAVPNVLNTIIGNANNTYPWIRLAPNNFFASSTIEPCVGIVVDGKSLCVDEFIFTVIRDDLQPEVSGRISSVSITVGFTELTE